MDKIKVKIDEMLNHFGNNNSISFSQDTTDEMFKARDKLRAFGLIEEHKKYSWRLTREGYKAIDLGGFDKWLKVQQLGDKQNKIISFIIKFWWILVTGVIISIISLSIEYGRYNLPRWGHNN